MEARSESLVPSGHMANTGSLDEQAIEWLLASNEPGIRLQARRDLLEERVTLPADQIMAGPLVSRLLAGQQSDGSFGVHPYQKWTGAHWRLVSLVELAVPPDAPGVQDGCDRVLDWLSNSRHVRAVRVIEGLPRRCASQEGNALAVASRLGRSDDPRAEHIARNLVEWQWPDGGWNCDLQASGKSSSFHESCAPMWGLHEYATATGAAWAREGALRTAEMFLRKRLFRSPRTGRVLADHYLVLHYPPYWHYDILQGLLVLSRLGVVADPRAAEALDELERKRLPDGRWRPGGYWWNKTGSKGGNVEVVDWGRGGPNEMITLNALRVLEAAGRV
jgi:hypothetical protein